MKLALKIYKRINDAKVEGLIISEDIVREAFSRELEEYLKDKHAETYQGTDDDMVEDFERYLTDVCENDELLGDLLQ